MIFLVTNALLFILLNRERLTDKAMEAVRDSDELPVSSVSFW